MLSRSLAAPKQRFRSSLQLKEFKKISSSPLGKILMSLSPVLFSQTLCFWAAAFYPITAQPVNHSLLSNIEHCCIWVGAGPDLY